MAAGVTGFARAKHQGNYWHYNRAAADGLLEPVLAHGRQKVWHPRYIKDGNDIFIIAGESAVNDSRALMGQFNLRVQASSGADAARKMKGFLQRTGMQDIMDDATEEALDRYKKMRVIWQTDPKKSHYLNPETTSDEDLNAILRQLGITQKRLDAIKMKKVTDGYYTFYDPENYKIAQQQNAAYLYHETTQTKAQKHFAAGSMRQPPITGHHDEGASTDAKTGGADVFTRLFREPSRQESATGLRQYVFVLTRKRWKDGLVAYTGDSSATPNNFNDARHGEHLHASKRHTARQ